MSIALPPMVAFTQSTTMDRREQNNLRVTSCSKHLSLKSAARHEKPTWLWLRSHPMQHQTRPLQPLFHRCPERRHIRDRNATADGPHRVLGRAATAHQSGHGAVSIGSFPGTNGRSRPQGRVPPSLTGTGGRRNGRWGWRIGIGDGLGDEVTGRSRGKTTEGGGEREAWESDLWGA